MRISHEAIRGIAEEYIRHYLPDEYPYFDLVWDSLPDHDPSGAFGAFARVKTWIHEALVTGLGFGKDHRMALTTTAIVMLLRSFSAEISKEMSVPSQAQIRDILLACASSAHLPHDDAARIEQWVPRLHAEIVAQLSGGPTVCKAQVRAGLEAPDGFLPGSYILTKRGANWQVVFEDEKNWVPHSLGMAYLSLLMHCPDKEFSNVSLMDQAGRLDPVSDIRADMVAFASDDELRADGMTRGHAVPSTSDTKISRSGYMEAMGRLADDMREARENSDLPAIEELEEKMSILRDRMASLPQSSVAEGKTPARQAGRAVSAAIGRAMDSIKSAGLVRLHVHLVRSLRASGGTRSYVPPSSIEWK